MKTPISWLAEHAELPAALSARQLADGLLRIGLEIERVELGAESMSGPIVVGRVVEYVDEPQRNGKTIRWCQVDVGSYNDGPQPRGIVCGAHNFAAGDLVVVSLPGAVLAGGFAISARKTYGHVSDGMICSVRELGIGDDHEGILVLPADSAKPGDDALDVLGLREAVLDIAVTTDRGYCLSIRGLAREAAAAFGVAFRDIAARLPEPDGRAYPVQVEDPVGCDRFSARAVTGLDPKAPTPDWLARRLRQCGMRSISLAVDVTNYVMLETGQPLHAFDRAKLTGPIGVRRARRGETLRTLDDTVRTLDPDDLVVTDDTGVIALGGVMGGASTEIGAKTTDVVLEAAHWEPESISRAVRRHKLPSEAARRFERGVDPEIAGVALARCVELLAAHGGAQAVDGYTVVGEPAAGPTIPLDVTLPAATAGMPIPAAEVVAHLEVVGAGVADPDATVLRVQPPTWRPDLTIPADLVEEVVRLAGYDRLPSTLPHAAAGGGLTPRQKLDRSIARSLADAGFVEVVSFPFVAPRIHDVLGLPPDDDRRRAARLVNPLSEDEPELRTSLLPGLLGTAVRNVGRGLRDLALFETGLVFLAPQTTSPAPLPGIERRPSAAQLAALDATLPAQPRHLGIVLCGDAEQAGWWGPGRPATWADAVAAARLVARIARAELTTRAARTAPWHPGRCAALIVDGTVIGYAGELHPRVVGELGLPARACAVELDLDALPVPAPARAPAISGYPPVLIDLALVVGTHVPAADVEATVRQAAGPLLESIRLFDVYADDARLGAGMRSLAFALRFRAPDRTLTLEEAVAARDAAVAAAGERHGARLRA
ncbi:MAG TPA: phenylalanine--tRNA ligase subunit beta [Jatrophihabitans sp.]|nr:phenylalanine--tRNA ligase subunit beta [Jatrophihabitans sp.]